MNPPASSAASERFNVLIVRAENSVHHEAYAGAARQLANGLRRLGRAARVAENEIVWDATNIVVGVHLLEAEALAQMPAGTIVYNVEMAVRGSPMLEDLACAVARFETWDYSTANIAAWHALGISDRVRHLRPGYLPEDTTADPDTSPDIDVLFYGSLNWRREGVLDAITRHGVTVHFAHNLYGPARNAMIARSKLVLNVASREDSVLEFARVVHVLAHRRVLVTEFGRLEDIDDDLAAGFARATPATFGEVCRELLADDARRTAIAARGFAALVGRDFTASLRNVLDARAAGS
ncbi:MAG: hypothetical protein ABI920_15340 [Casimicrobiaceae bacterium]